MPTKTLTPREVRCFLPVTELEGVGIGTQAWVALEHSVPQTEHVGAGRACPRKGDKAGRGGQEKPSSALRSVGRLVLPAVTQGPLRPVGPDVV